MGKNYVAVGKLLCPVCGQLHGSGAILFHTRLGNIPEPAVMGQGLCPEHQRLFDAGYLALVGVDASKSVCSGGGTLTQENAHRTGAIVHIRREVFTRLLKGITVPDSTPMCFVDEAVISALTDRAGEQ